MPSAYHITRIENIPAIWEAGHLACDDDVACLQNRPHTFAYEDIKSRRRRKVIPVGPGGTLSSYVPFYFAHRSPMLATVFYRDRDRGTHDQDLIAHFRVEVEQIATENLPFVFSDGHGIMDLTNFYANLTDLNRVDWNLIRSTSWFDTVDDPDRKRRKQAEFLVHKRLPIRHIIEIGVKNDHARREVEFLLAFQAVRPPVVIRPEWYYR